MENKTAMQELLEWTRKTLPMDLDTPKMIEEKIESLLEMEKEQKQLDYIAGHDLCRCVTDNTDEAKECFEEYYNTTYANDTTTGLPKEDSKRRAWHR